MNFVGQGVTAADIAGVARVTVPSAQQQFPDIVDTPGVQVDINKALFVNAVLSHFQQAPHVGSGFQPVLWQDIRGQFLRAEQSSLAPRTTWVAMSGVDTPFQHYSSTGQSNISLGGTVDNAEVSSSFMNINSPVIGGATVTGFVVTNFAPDIMRTSGMIVHAVNNGIVGGGGSITLANENAGSLAANRIRTNLAGTSIIIPPYGGWTMIWVGEGGGRWLIQSIKT
jgi:hypothetical protein